LFAESTLLRQQWCDGLNVRLEQIKRQSTRLQLHLLSCPQATSPPPLQHITKLEPESKTPATMKISRSQSFDHATSAERIDNKRERSEKIKTLRKTDSFASATTRNIIGLAPSTRTGQHGSAHARKKSSGKVQDEINEYVRISIWMQKQEIERAQKGATDNKVCHML
jgi:hypothetical protein